MTKRIERKSKMLEALLWSIAFPGFGQLLNRKYIKGVLLVVLEFTVNVLGNVNQVIMLSFHGHIQEAINQTNYLWFMFRSEEHTSELQSRFDLVCRLLLET